MSRFVAIEWDPCPCCGGSGVHEKRTAVDAYEHQYTCGRCGGSGEVPEDDDVPDCREIAP